MSECMNKMEDGWVGELLSDCRMGCVSVDE